MMRLSPRGAHLLILVVDASVEPPALPAELVALLDPARTLVVANKAGTATLEVTSDDGRRDRLELTAAAVDPQVSPLVSSSPSMLMPRSTR